MYFLPAVLGRMREEGEMSTQQVCKANMGTEKQFKLKRHFYALWQAPMTLPGSSEGVSPQMYVG